jgi:hypothetical protein
MKKSRLPLTLVLLLLAGGLWAAPAPVRGIGFEVDSFVDDMWAHDLNPGDCDCADTFGGCTLRAAIEEANACTGPDTITFDSPMNIYLDTTLNGLIVTETVTIDASGVWNAADNEPGVMVHAGSGSFAVLFLDSGADSCQVYGLYVTASGGTGVYVTTAGNTIGGPQVGQRNVMSGNYTGLTLSGSGATNNLVHNNYIGLTPGGDTKNPNATGILITGGAKNNVIGGPDPSLANVISGNTTNGVMVEGSGTDGNALASNIIGPSADLVTALGNGHYGVRIQSGAGHTTIGGFSSTGNLIAYSGSSGVHVSTTALGTEISYNIIGNNSLDGISIYDTTGTLVAHNWITGNTLAGVRVSGATASENLIWPNSIYANGSKGIAIVDGANMGIVPPVITSATTRLVKGTGGCPGCKIAVYSDTEDEGQLHAGSAVSDSSGRWTYQGPVLGPNVTATVVDVLGNTSEFSLPYDVSAWHHWAFLPAIVR